MDFNEVPLPEPEGENGPPKKLSRRNKSSSSTSSEMEVEVGVGDGPWNLVSGDCLLNTRGTDGVSSSGEQHSEQKSKLHVAGCSYTIQSASGSTDYNEIWKGTTLDRVVEDQILKPAKHLAADISGNVPYEKNSPSASSNQFGVDSGANPCEGLTVDGFSSVNSKGENDIGVCEAEWVNSESVGILDVSVSSQPDRDCEKTDHFDGSDHAINIDNGDDSCSARDCLRPSTHDAPCTTQDCTRPTTRDNSCTTQDCARPTTRDNSCTTQDCVRPTTRDNSCTTQDCARPTTRDNSCTTQDCARPTTRDNSCTTQHCARPSTHDNSCTTQDCVRPTTTRADSYTSRDCARPGTSANYTPGGCECSSELVATLVLQRHHTPANCDICSRNLDLRPIGGVTSPNACEMVTQNYSHVAKDISVGESISCGASEPTDFNTDSPPGGSDSDQSLALQFNELPVPIILKTFGCLSRFEQLRKLALVCKFWNSLTQDPELWRIIDLRGQFKLTNRILDRLTSYSDHVTSIDLSDSKLISSTGVAALTKRCHSLQVLKLSRCYSLNTLAFRSIGENCSSLQKLHFDICYSLTDTDIQCIAEGCPRLTILSLNHCDSITDEGVKAVARHCPLLEAINLDHLGKLTHLSLEALSCNCPKLYMVSLMSVVMNDEGILHLTQLPNLSILDVSNITALTKKSVTRVVMRCKLLTKLNICLMRWVDDEMIEVIARNASNLKTLHCVSCNITDNGLKIIADNAKNLEVLDVSWCNDLTADGVQYIAERCRTLRFISLIRCDRVTMETLTDFVDRYPRIHFSSFFLDAQRLLKKAMEQGYM